MDPRRRAELERAYLATTYAVGSLRLRIGKRSADLDALLAGHGADACAALTAWNPMSEPRNREENDAAQRVLLARLEGRPLLLGEARADADDWPPEEIVLAVGLGEREALDLARVFGQAAIVVARRGEAPRLAWT